MNLAVQDNPEERHNPAVSRHVIDATSSMIVSIGIVIIVIAIDRIAQLGTRNID